MKTMGSGLLLAGSKDLPAIVAHPVDVSSSHTYGTIRVRTYY